jgi:hypothetical protein
METTSGFGSCLTACQGLNKLSIAARLNGQPLGKIETEGDLIGNGCGGTRNGHQGPTTGVRIEAVDAFEPESATSGDERARGVEAISWASDTPAVAYATDGKLCQRRGKELAVAASISQSAVSDECRD